MGKLFSSLFLLLLFYSALQCLHIHSTSASDLGWPKGGTGTLTYRHCIKTALCSLYIYTEVQDITFHFTLHFIYVLYKPTHIMMCVAYTAVHFVYSRKHFILRCDN
jgi:hypothetical protein